VLSREAFVLLPEKGQGPYAELPGGWREQAARERSAFSHEPAALRAVKERRFMI